MSAWLVFPQTVMQLISCNRTMHYFENVISLLEARHFQLLCILHDNTKTRIVLGIWERNDVGNGLRVQILRQGADDVTTRVFNSTGYFYRRPDYIKMHLL
jgi:hypothetical protein